MLTDLLPALFVVALALVAYGIGYVVGYMRANGWWGARLLAEADGVEPSADWEDELDAIEADNDND